MGAVNDRCPGDVFAVPGAPVASVDGARAAPTSRPSYAAPSPMPDGPEQRGGPSGGGNVASVRPSRGASGHPGTGPGAPPPHAVVAARPRRTGPRRTFTTPQPGKSAAPVRANATAEPYREPVAAVAPAPFASGAVAVAGSVGGCRLRVGLERPCRAPRGGGVTGPGFPHGADRAEPCWRRGLGCALVPAAVVVDRRWRADSGPRSTRQYRCPSG